MLQSVTNFYKQGFLYYKLSFSISNVKLLQFVTTQLVDYFASNSCNCCNNFFCLHKAKLITFKSTSFKYIVVYNPFGNIVPIIANERQEKGNHKKIFDSNNLSAGIYYCAFTVNGKTAVKRIALIK